MNITRSNNEVYIEADPEVVAEHFQKHRLSLYFDLLNDADFDFQCAGDEQCVGNFDMAYPVYDAYSGLIFFPTGKDCADYLDGKIVHLYGRIPDQDEIDAINNYYGD